MQIGIVLAVTGWMFALCFFLGLILALPASEGKQLQLKEQVPVFQALLSFLILLPAFPITGVLAFLRMRFASLATLCLFLVLVYWLLTEGMGNPPSVSEFSADFADLASVARDEPHSNEGFLLFVMLSVLLQPVLTCCLLILPRKYDPYQLLFFGMAIPILFVLYLSLPSHQNNNSDIVDFTTQESQHPVTPLMVAAGDGTPEEIKAHIAKGIDINAKNIYGTNALMYAALAGRTENIKVLLAAGARVNDQDHKGNTALSLARQQGHQEAVALLVAAGAKEKSPPTR